MPVCPKCNADIQSEFGVMNCPSCRAMVSINFDGSVDLSEDLEREKPETTQNYVQEESFTDQQSSFVAEEGSFVGAPVEESVAEVIDTEKIKKNIQENQNDDWQDVKNEQPKEEATTENYFVTEEVARSTKLDSPDMSDVEEYANSELSSSPVGGLLYDLRIEGIDTAAIREEIRLELANKKYHLNVESLLKSMQDGKIIIRGLNAAKATLIVNHLKHLDIEMQWKQNEIIRM